MNQNRHYFISEGERGGKSQPVDAFLAQSVGFDLLWALPGIHH